MSEAVNEAVTVTHQSLIALRQAGERLAPPPGRIRAARAVSERPPAAAVTLPPRTGVGECLSWVVKQIGAA